MSIYTPGSTPKEEKKQPVTLTFRICINTPSGSSSQEYCNLAQDCFKVPRLAAVAGPQAPQVETIEPSKVEKGISIREASHGGQPQELRQSRANNNKSAKGAMM